MVFSILLPEDPKNLLQLQPEKKLLTHMPSHYRVARTLIVDDSEEEYELFRAQVRQVASINIVRYVRDGLEAMAYLWGTHEFGDRSRFPYPDLMLLDLHMPRCSGMEVLELLTHEPRRPRVVLWSNALQQCDITSALDLGADVVCTKPSSLCELGDILNRLEEGVSRRGSFGVFSAPSRDHVNLCKLNASL